MSKVILVTGATGKQGGSCIQALLAAPNATDFTLLAVTRNPESASAKKLAEQGVKIVQGDLNDVPAIFESAKKVVDQPIWGVFSVQVLKFGITPILKPRLTFLFSFRMVKERQLSSRRPKERLSLMALWLLVSNSSCTPPSSVAAMTSLTRTLR